MNRLETVSVRTLAPAWPVLLCIELFAVWQMGVVYYASASLTAGGPSPLPFAVPDTAMLIAAGYLVSAALIGFFPRESVWLGRGVLGLSLLCSCLLLLPLPETLRSALFCATVFFCIVMIGLIAVQAINRYALSAALLDGVLGALLSSAGVILLQGGFLKVSAYQSLVVSVFLQGGALAGFCLLPAEAPLAPAPPKKEEGARPPAVLLCELAVFIAAACLGTLFSSALAEGVPFGNAALYAGTGVSAVLLLFLCRRNDDHRPLRAARGFLAAAAAGFLLWLLPFEGLRLPGLVLQGAGILICNLTWLYGAMLFARWPSRRIAPACVLVALVTVLIHTALLGCLRETPALLHSVYAVIAIGLYLLYLTLEPYLIAAWNRSREAQTADRVLAPWLSSMTPREREVVELIAEGHSNAAIAQQLYLSEQTVKSYVKIIYRKAEVHSRGELLIRYNEKRP